MTSSWQRRRRAWREEFERVGELRVRRKLWAKDYGREKHLEAERWLRWEETKYKKIGLGITAVGAVVGILGLFATVLK